MDWNLKKLANFFKFGHGVFQKSPKTSYGSVSLLKLIWSFLFGLSGMLLLVSVSTKFQFPVSYDLKNAKLPWQCPFKLAETCVVSFAAVSRESVAWHPKNGLLRRLKHAWPKINKNTTPQDLSVAFAWMKQLNIYPMTESRVDSERFLNWNFVNKKPHESTAEWFILNGYSRTFLQHDKQKFAGKWDSIDFRCCCM